ncbi:MAG TPA: endonuclease III [Patescibacteria group bacterium]|nr:endonuclease III [Patescibacteria group bacterium]
MTSQKHASLIFDLLKSHYPDAKMVLQWGNNFELLVAVILSAQCTDKKVNEVTASLFPKYQQKRKGLEDRYANYTRINVAKEQLIELVNFANVPITELEQDIKPTGFYHNKAKSLQNAAKTVLEKFNGLLPKTIAELTTIPGVGRKTANVFLTNAYHIDEGIAVDTHVTKQARLLGLTKKNSPEKIEQDLMKLFPKSQWHQLTYMLIEHGRNVRRKKSDRILCNDKNCILCKSYR